MVHQYKLNGYNLVLDTCSGGVHVVDEVAYDLIALYPDHTPEEIVQTLLETYRDRPDVTEAELRECLADVEALVKSGQLYTPDTFSDIAGTFKQRSGDVVKALCLHVAHTCNLNCSYCFLLSSQARGSTTGTGPSCPSRWASRPWTSSSPTPEAERTWKWTSSAANP